MRLSPLLPALTLLLGCGPDKGATGNPEIDASIPGVTSYDDLASHPESVQAVARKIEDIPPGSSVEDYQKALSQTGLIEVPYEHFKDYKYYWRVRSSDENPPMYIVTGAFAHLTDNLAYSTIDVIMEAGGEWRTIWSIQHDPESGLLLKPAG